MASGDGNIPNGGQNAGKVAPLQAEQPIIGNAAMCSGSGNPAKISRPLANFPAAETTDG